MSSEFDQPEEPAEPAQDNAERRDQLYWRAALGQATADLLAAGRTVTIATLISWLQGSERQSNLVLTRVSTRAAIRVLRSLQRRAEGADDPKG